MRWILGCRVRATMAGMTTPFAERYGAPRPWVRSAVVVGTTLLAVGFLGWLAWAAWFHGSPDAESELVSYDVRGVHETVAVVHVALADGVEASCRVRALARDHTTVGETAFTPTPGRNEVSIRTEREATSVDLVGCRTPDQPRPR